MAKGVSPTGRRNLASEARSCLSLDDRWRSTLGLPNASSSGGNALPSCSKRTCVGRLGPFRAVLAEIQTEPGVYGRFETHGME
jgi:hypothetical protein